MSNAAFLAVEIMQEVRRAAFIVRRGVASAGASRSLSMQPLIRGMSTTSVQRRWAVRRAAPSYAAARPPPSSLVRLAASPRPPATMRTSFATTSNLRKKFCIAGPARHDMHYALDVSHLSEGNVEDPSALFHLDRCVDAIRDEEYFTIHGARQSMKTSFLRTLQRHINTDNALKNDYECVYVSLERIQVGKDDELSISRKICVRLIDAADRVSDDVAGSVFHDYAGALEAPLAPLLSRWSYRLWTEEKKSLVILFDEFDNLRGEPLLFVLGELRSGYVERSDHRYPTSIVLCGMRRLQDYKTEDGKSILGTSSPFNVAIGPLHTVPLTRDQVAELYAQHTDATGQRFEAAAVDRAFYWTQGQPWLVNRIGYEVTTRMAASGRQPPAEPLTAAHIDTAVYVMINERSTHLDSLMSVLREERVRSVMENVLRGEPPESGIDSTFCFELGLLATKADDYRVANPLYEQVLPRAMLELFDERRRLAMRFAAHRLVLPDTGGFDLATFVQRFCDFAREHMPRKGLESDGSNSPALWLQEKQFELLLVASLYQSINGSGRVIPQRNLGHGERRVDVTIELPRICLDNGQRYALSDAGRTERIVLELKMGVKRQEGVKDAAIQFPTADLKQVADYAQRLGRVDRMALIVFDTNDVAMPGTDLSTSLYHTVLPLRTDGNRIVECYALHLPFVLIGRSSSVCDSVVAQR